MNKSVGSPILLGIAVLAIIFRVILGPGVVGGALTLLALIVGISAVATFIKEQRSGSNKK